MNPQSQISIPTDAQTILKKLTQSGFESYVVGGCVRDALLQREMFDWDICTAATPAQMRVVFAGDILVATGEVHGTLTLVINGNPYEITSFRADGAYADARHPNEVQFGVSLAEDLARRDFTINAMAYAPKAGIVDLFGGKADLNEGVLRCVGDAQTRFSEDALRILRAVRFAATHGFTLANATKSAAQTQKENLKKVSVERITIELSKLLCGHFAADALQKYGELLTPILGAENPETWPVLCAGLREAPPVLAARLALLARAVGEPILQNLRLSNSIKKDANAILKVFDMDVSGDEVAARHAMYHHGEILFTALETRAAWEKASSNGNENHTKTANFFKIVLAQKTQNACTSLKALAVNGVDALSAGIAPGAAVGKALETALNAVMNGESPNTKQALLSLLRFLASTL